MQNFKKWALASLLVCSGVYATSQTETVTQWVDDKALTNIKDAKVFIYSAQVTKVEDALKQTQFDRANKMHQLRLKRIIHYLSQARTFERQNWLYNRDDAIERATNILRHHQVKTEQLNVI